MPDYFPGAVLAGEALSRDRYRDMEMQRMLQSITQGNILFQEQQEERKRQLEAASKGIETLIGLQPPPADTSQPPPPQPPAPGQPSMPMQPQGAPPQMTTQGQGMPPTPPAPPMGPPSQINLAPGTMTPGNLARIAADAQKSGYQPPTLGPNGPSVGYTPSPLAKPELGGRPPSSPPASQSTGELTAPPAPNVGMRQGQMIDPKAFVARAIKQGATPLQAYEQLKMMEPAINAHNKQVMDDFGEQAKIAKMVIDYQQYLLRAAREGRLGDIGEQREQRLAAREGRLEAGKGEVATRSERASPSVATTSNDPLVQADSEIRDNVRRTQAWAYINTRMLPYRKGTGGGRDRNDEVMQTVGEIEKELNKTPEEIAGMPATWKADAAALTQLTKKRDSIAGQLESFHNNLRTWDQLAKGLPPTFGGQATKDFSKKLESINFTGVRSLDDVKLKIQQQVNDPTVSAYMVAAMAAAMDYARIMQGPQSAASLTEGARKDAERLVNAAADNEARAGIIAAMDSDTQGQVAGLDSQIQRTTDRLEHKSPKDESVQSTKTTQPVREFSNEAEAAKANLPVGTRVKIGGRMATVQ